jgi:cytoskeleton protein RodZ
VDLKFIEEIRAARIERNITLQDISSATRINTRFLEAIEQGEFDVLPKPYVRSFIKQYVRHVGFDPEPVLDRFDNYNTQRTGSPQEREPVPSFSAESNVAANSPRLKMVFLSLIVIGVFALIAYLLVELLGSESEPIVERPFQEVVREVEEQASRTPIEPIDTLRTLPTVQQDSLLVSITAIDTVWLTVTLDNLTQEEYIFPPGRVQRWRAANELLLTIGNAGGISMVVDGDSVGVLGAPGQVMRNVQITRDGIQR